MWQFCIAFQRAFTTDVALRFLQLNINKKFFLSIVLHKAWALYKFIVHLILNAKLYESHRKHNKLKKGNKTKQESLAEDGTNHDLALSWGQRF